MKQATKELLDKLWYSEVEHKLRTEEELWTVYFDERNKGLTDALTFEGWLEDDESDGICQWRLLDYIDNICFRVMEGFNMAYDMQEWAEIGMELVKIYGIEFMDYTEYSSIAVSA